MIDVARNGAEKLLDSMNRIIAGKKNNYDGVAVDKEGGLILGEKKNEGKSL